MNIGFPGSGSALGFRVEGLSLMALGEASASGYRVLGLWIESCGLGCKTC